MENMKYVPIGLFLAYVSKLLVLGGVSIVDAPIVLILATLTAFYEIRSLQSKKLIELETKIDACNKEILNKNKDIDDLKSNIASIKLSNNIRTTSLR